MTSEEAEFREVLVRSLDARGVFSKLKAEVQANVILALEQQEGEEGGGSTLMAPEITKYSETREGELIIGLVREFLQFHELDYSLTVFEPECNLEGNTHSRKQLIQDMGIKKIKKDSSLLHHLIFKKSPVSTVSDSQTQQTSQPQDSITNTDTQSDSTNSEKPIIEYSQPTASVSLAGEQVSDFDITNENSDILAPADDLSDRNSQSDLDEFFSGMGGTGFSQNFLNVKDLVPQTKGTSQERPRSARGSGRPPTLSSLQGAPPLIGPNSNLEMELKSILKEPNPTRSGRNLPREDLSATGPSQHSYSESIDELKMSIPLDSTLVSHSNETTDHTTSAVSLGDLDYVEDVLKK